MLALLGFGPLCLKDAGRKPLKVSMLYGFILFEIKRSFFKILLGRLWVKIRASEEMIGLEVP